MKLSDVFHMMTMYWHPFCAHYFRCFIHHQRLPPLCSGKLVCKLVYVIRKLQSVSSMRLWCLELVLTLGTNINV